MTPKHLIPFVSDRGFQSMPDVVSVYGGARIYESSNAAEPCLWVRLEECSGVRGVAAVEFTLEEAAKLRDQLDYLISSHYQKGY